MLWEAASSHTAARVPFPWRVEYEAKKQHHPSSISPPHQGHWLDCPVSMLTLCACMCGEVDMFTDVLSVSINVINKCTSTYTQCTSLCCSRHELALSSTTPQHNHPQHSNTYTCHTHMELPGGDFLSDVPFSDLVIFGS